LILLKNRTEGFSAESVSIPDPTWMPVFTGMTDY
jgi:hypothetical protein